MDRWDDSLVDPPLSEQNRRRNRGMREAMERSEQEPPECTCLDRTISGHEPGCAVAQWLIDRNEAQHSVKCGARKSWVQTYVSRDEDRNIVAFEFYCSTHKENFWLAVPPPTPARGEQAPAERWEFCPATWSDSSGIRRCVLSPGHGEVNHQYVIQQLPQDAMDEFKELIRKAQTPFERFTVERIAMQRQKITALEATLARERQLREQAEHERDEARRLHECYCEDPVRLAMRGEPIPDGFGGHEPDCCIGEYYREERRAEAAEAREARLRKNYEAINAENASLRAYHGLVPATPEWDFGAVKAERDSLRATLERIVKALEDAAAALADVRDVLLMDRNNIDAVQSAVKRADAALARLEASRASADLEPGA